jgi:hypothetical protein
MSDWQHCVDWLLAKCCKCRSRLDWCWCRWRASMKGRCQVGLQVWTGKVGLAGGTRWPAGSSAGRWNERQDEVINGFLVEPQNQGRAGTTWERSHECLLAEATLNSRGFQWFTRKPLGSLVDPQSQDRRPEHRDRSDQCAMMQSKDFKAEDTRRDHKVCVEANQVCGRRTSVRWCYDEISQKALRGHVS